MSTRTMHILQKLGFPTKLATSYQAYYDSPIEDMAHGESIQIYPGANKLDYRMEWHVLGTACSRAEHSVVTVPE